MVVYWTATLICDYKIKGKMEKRKWEDGAELEYFARVRQPATAGPAQAVGVAMCSGEGGDDVV
jgi:hypothetical protein